MPIFSCYIKHNGQNNIRLKKSSDAVNFEHTKNLMCVFVCVYYNSYEKNHMLCSSKWKNKFLLFSPVNNSHRFIYAIGHLYNNNRLD